MNTFEETIKGLKNFQFDNNTNLTSKKVLSALDKAMEAKKAKDNETMNYQEEMIEKELKRIGWTTPARTKEMINEIRELKRINCNNQSYINTLEKMTDNCFEVIKILLDRLEKKNEQQEECNHDNTKKEKRTRVLCVKNVNTECKDCDNCEWKVR